MPEIRVVAVRGGVDQFFDLDKIGTRFGHRKNACPAFVGQQYPGRVHCSSYVAAFRKVDRQDRQVPYLAGRFTVMRAFSAARGLPHSTQRSARDDALRSLQLRGEQVMTTSSNTDDLVIVTGGTGFIGRALVDRLARDHAVMVFDQQCPPHLRAGVECVAVDLTSDDSVHAALERVRSGHGDHIASVIHLAAYFDLEGKPHPDYERVTVRGTERLLRELQAFRVDQFVFASTMLVHAPAPPGQRIDEDSPLDAASLPYRESKIRTERLIHERRGNVPVVIVRPAGVYDDGGHAVFIAHQIARIYERKLNSRVYPGNLDTGQPYLHLDDLVEAFALIVRRREGLPPELPLLLAEPETPTFRQLQDEIGRLVHGHAWKTMEIPQAVAMLGASLEEKVLDEDPFIRPWMVKSASDHYEIDISRAERWLGWRPRHSLRSTLPKIVEALKADPAGWYRSNKLNPAVVADQAPAVRERREHLPGVPQHRRAMRDMHFAMLWTHFLNILLGAWLVCCPFAFGLFDMQSFGDAVRQVTVERQLSDPMQRLMWLGLSDIASGVLIMVFGAPPVRAACPPWARTMVA